MIIKDELEKRKEKIKKAQIKAKQKIGNILIKTALLTSVFTGIGAVSAQAQEKKSGETLKGYNEFLNTPSNEAIKKTATSNYKQYLEGLEMFDEYMTFGEIKEGSRVDDFEKYLTSLKKTDPQFYENVTENIDNFSVAFLSYLEMDNQRIAEKDNIQGYDMGNYDITFTINKSGDISYLLAKGDKPVSEEHLAVINEAISREKGLGVDRMDWRMDASKLVTDMKVKQIIEKKQANGESVTNGDAFLTRLDKKIKENGLQINDKGRLEPTSENLQKPLKTEKILLQEYQVKIAKEKAEYMKQYR